MGIGGRIRELVADPRSATDLLLAELRARLDLARPRGESRLARAALARLLHAAEAGGTVADGRFLRLTGLRGQASLATIDLPGELTASWPLPGAAPARGRLLDALVRRHPGIYRQLLREALGPLRGRVAGVLLVPARSAAVEQAVHACRELGIASILVLEPGAAPAEDFPTCDVTLCRDRAQYDALAASGLPEERLQRATDAAGMLAALRGLRTAKPAPLRAESFYEHLFTDHHGAHGFGTAAFYRIPTRGMVHVEAMLDFRRLLLSPSPAAAQRADVFVKWGIRPTAQKDEQDRLAEQLERPQLTVEDGFLRSVDIGLSGEAALSIMVDSQTAYYDATRPSRLEERLNGPDEPSAAQRARAERCMQAIRAARISKYNHAPDTQRAYGPAPRLLLVDQRFGDQSIASGLADESSFDRMLHDALRERPGHTILVKRHPDATRGGKASYFADDRLAAHRGEPRLVLIDEEVNPHTLFDQVDEVFVATSGMGMEALIAGRRVRCYGVPFYAGWGLTDDRVAVPRRTRPRTLADVFHFSYIESSRYFSPATGRAGEIEDVIAYLAEHRAR